MKLNEEYLIGMYTYEGIDHPSLVKKLEFDRCNHNGSIIITILSIHSDEDKKLDYKRNFKPQDINRFGKVFLNIYTKKYPNIFINNQISGIDVNYIDVNYIINSLIYVGTDYIVRLKRDFTINSWPGHPIDGKVIPRGYFGLVNPDAIDNSWKDNTDMIGNFPQIRENPFYPITIPKSELEIVYNPHESQPKKEDTMKDLNITKNPYLFVKYSRGNAYYTVLASIFNKASYSDNITITHAVSGAVYITQKSEILVIDWEAIPLSYKLDIMSSNDLVRPYLIEGELETKNKNLKQTQNKTQTKKMETSKKKGMMGNLLGGLNMEFGKLDRNDIAYSMMGIALQKKDGNWVAYNAQAGEIVEIGDFQMDVDFYQIPVQTLTKGDYTIIDGTIYLVNEVKTNGDLSCICPTTGSKATKVKRNNLFNMYFYTKIVNMFDMMGGLNNSTTTPGGMNPMMLMMMMGNNNSGENSNMGGMMEMLMMSQMFGGQGNANPLANIFGQQPVQNTESALGGMTIDDARELAEFKKWKSQQAKDGQ